MPNESELPGCGIGARHKIVPSAPGEGGTVPGNSWQPSVSQVHTSGPFAPLKVGVKKDIFVMEFARWEKG